jgi:hypothetical protein
MAHDSLKAQLDLAHDERIWQQRADTYLQLLVWMAEWDDKLSMVTSDLSTVDLIGEQAEGYRLSDAKVVAFGSAEVVELAKVWRSAVGEFATVWRKILASKDTIVTPQLNADITSKLLKENLATQFEPFASISDKLTLIRSDLRSQIRFELQHMRSLESSPPPELESRKRSWNPDEWITRQFDSLNSTGRDVNADDSPHR